MDTKSPNRQSDLYRPCRYENPSPNDQNVIADKGTNPFALFVQLFDAGRVTDLEVVQELRRIYSEILRDEEEVSEYCSPHMIRTKPKLPVGKLLELRTTHQRLLTNYDRFFFVSRHPLAADSVQNLVSKHDVPARISRCVLMFLELLSYNQPQPLKYTFEFLVNTNSLVANLDTTYPEFRGAWDECLGSVAWHIYLLQSQSGISQSQHDWANVSHLRFEKGCDGDPENGMRYHSIAQLGWLPFMEASPPHQITLRTDSLRQGSGNNHEIPVQSLHQG